MKRLTVWLVSLVLGLVTTIVLFEFTPINIPFIAGGAFTLITILFLAFFFSLVLDSILKARVYDEHGLHFGPITFGAAPSRKEPGPPPDYQPIVSREERLKQEQKLQAGGETRARRH